MEYNKRRRVIIVASILTIGIAVVFAFFLISNSKRIEKQNTEYLYNLTSQRAEYIDSLVKENITFIRSAAYLYGSSMKSAKPDLGMLEDYKANTAFDDLWFIDIYGCRYTGKKNRIDLSGNEFYASGLHGGAGVTYFGVGKNDVKKRVGFYAPVYHNNTVAGILLGIYDRDHISEMLDYDLFGVQGTGWLCDSDGTVISSNLELPYDNYLDYIKDTGGATLEEVSHISHLFNYGQGSSFSYKQDGNEIRCCAAGIPYAGWVLIMSFPPEAYRTMLSRTNMNSLFVILILAAVFAAYIAIMYISFSREKTHLDKRRRDAEDIAKGMASLFGNCMTLDLKTKVYNYVIGVPDDPKLPPSGDYILYYESILTRIEDITNRRHASDFFDTANLKTALTDKDSASIRLHLAREGVDEWEIFTFIVLSRNERDPERLLLVSHNAFEAFDS